MSNNEAPRSETKVYAEHERLHLVKDKSQAIGEFIDWLTQEQGVFLARAHEHSEGCYVDCDRVCGALKGEIIPCHVSIQKWLAIYFDIDLKKIEQEKREMLAEIRLASAKREIEKELGL